jgi:vacuolar-type H+-ATPase subunit H
MDKPTTDGLSPLDQIRLAEGEVTRKVIVTREASEKNTAEARAQAGRLKKEAKEKGEREGQIRYKEIIAGAEEEAKAILAQAGRNTEALRRNGGSRMERAVERALQIVLGTSGTGDDHES